MVIKIKNRIIKKGDIFIIAEGGVNHNGDMNLAKELIVKAKEAGADAIKFQTYKTEKLIIKNKKTENFFNMIKRLELSEEDFIKLKDFAIKNDIIFLSTPDEEDSLNFLLSLNLPAIKIGSGEANNIDFLIKVAKTKKVVLISTGCCNEEEIDRIYQTVYPLNKKMILMHCISEYPAKIESLNLQFIKKMIKKYNCPIGFSDHTTSIFTPSIAYILGATVIEKHFTLDKNLPGPDHSSSLDVGEFKSMVNLIYETKEALGKDIRKITESEDRMRKFIRKSLFSKSEIKKGETLTKENTILLRPEIGIRADQATKVYGKRIKIKKNKFKPIFSNEID
ncbi:MAG: N-acetylneuraminate synthase family protein [candidate division WOR-3 bacterium]